MKNARKTRFDAIFDVAVTVICLLCMLVVLYPLYFCVIASISDPTAIANGRVILAPRDITWSGYKFLFMDSRIFTGYKNTIVYALGSTVLGLLLTIPAGYALSRPDLAGRKWILKYYVFTMYFSGGMIPTYILVRNIGLIDYRVTVILMGSFAVYNLLVTRTFFANTLPIELWEAAEIDGANFFQKIWHVTFPTLKALIIINFVGAFIASAQSGGMILIMTFGRANTEVAELHIFKEAYTNLQFGSAISMAWVLGMMTLMFTIYNLKRLSKMEFKTTGK